jgi:hypothetical protein
MEKHTKFFDSRVAFTTPRPKGTSVRSSHCIAEGYKPIAVVIGDGASTNKLWPLLKEFNHRQPTST